MKIKKKEIKPFFFDLSRKDKKLFMKNVEDILQNKNFILGKYTKNFELEFAKKNNSNYAVAVNSGTTALEILISYNTKFLKCKVAVQSNTNFATIASIIRSNGYPVYLDMDPNYLSPTYKNVIEKYKKFKFSGLVWVHIGGIINPDFFRVQKFCKKNNIFLVEDCAHAHGSVYKNVNAGNFGSGGAFSFFPTKVMTTMEGGMITTNNSKIRDYAISMRNQGKGKQNFGCYHIDMGNSWRMLEISAALGIIQLKNLNKNLKIRKNIEKIYSDKLKNSSIKFSKTQHMSLASNYKFVIYGKNENHSQKIKTELKKENIFCGGGVYELACHSQPVFKKYKKFIKDLRNTNIYCKKQICLPIHHGMTKEDAKRCILRFIETYERV
jgi:perosamine synthetase